MQLLDSKEADVVLVAVHYGEEVVGLRRETQLRRQIAANGCRHVDIDAALECIGGRGMLLRWWC